jgi:predicted nuclease of predicted toxin-antitoxin system
MKLLLDQNLSRRIPSLIADIFPGSNHVGSLALDCVSDQEIWDFAESEGYVILSKDSDFHQMSLVRGFPPKVIFLKIGNCSTDLILSLIRKHERDFQEFNNDGNLSLLIVGL